MLVVNLFGSPGAGKSTCAAYIFSKLKMLGINVELITEFAKDKTWEENFTALKDQILVFANQNYKLRCCKDKVDVVITDSPLPLSLVYNGKASEPLESLDSLVLEVFDSYNNINFYIKRVKPYNPIGRSQTEEQSDGLANEIIDMLAKQKIDYQVVSGDIKNCDAIVETIISSIHA